MMYRREAVILFVVVSVGGGFVLGYIVPAVFPLSVAVSLLLYIVLVVLYPRLMLHPRLMLRYLRFVWSSPPEKPALYR